jgi:hypothetical protein
MVEQAPHYAFLALISGFRRGGADVPRGSAALAC